MRSARLRGMLVVSLLACGGSPRGHGSMVGTSGVSSGDADDDGADGDPGGDEKLDASASHDLGAGAGCPEGSGAADGSFSYVWIANSPEGTVSKIDARSGEEVARYYTGPGQGTDDPSRTSVNLAGDVAVANRSGGIAKLATRPEDCVDGDGDGDIDTSTGPADVRPFGADECLVWHLPLPGGGGSNQQGPRPVAWDAGPGGDACDVSDDRVWVGWFDLPANAGRFYRLGGSTGERLDDVVVPDWDATGEKVYGPYGGATDGDGNLWVLGLAGPLARIDGTTLQPRTWPVPEGSSPYGLALDADGHPWTAGLDGEILHFDPDAESFQRFQIGATLRGVQIDRTGALWAAVNGPCGLMHFDTKSKTVVAPHIALPDCGTPVGVSIDVDGYVWLPDQTADAAHKYDPVTGEATRTPGLRGPYTYSDMTGSGLGLVTHPPAG